MTILKLSKKAGFILAVAGAAAIGGLTTAMVRAAIPSTADNQINACYLNNDGLNDAKGTLRVIDSQATPAQSCTEGETALNITQPKKAYVNFGYVLDGTNHREVSSTGGIDTIDPGENGTYCMKVSFSPKTASSGIAIRGVSTDEDTEVDSYCDSTYNAMIAGVGPYTKAVFFD